MFARLLDRAAAVVCDWKQTTIFCVLIFSAAIVWASYNMSPARVPQYRNQTYGYFLLEGDKATEMEMVRRESPDG